MAMAVVAIVYAGVGLYRVVHAARNFGAVYMGMSRPEVRYLFGAPVAQGERGQLWRMREGQTETTVLFDGADRVTAVGCRGDGTGCPDAMGVRVGDGEEAVWRLFGFPSTEQFQGDRKIMAYPELGIRFDLRRGTVFAIEHRRWQGATALGARAISLLAP